MLEHLEKMFSKFLLEEDKKRLRSAIRLSVVYRQSGQREESIRLLESTLKIGRRSLDEDHHLALEMQYELAVVYWGEGRTQVNIPFSRVTQMENGEALEQL